jgi:hypothetical protein
MNRKVIIPVITLALASIVGIGAYTGLASASYGNGNGPDVSSLAEKLGVEESKVEEAFNQMCEERQAERQAQLSENLDKAVTDGKITALQKQLILEKHNSIETEKRQRGQEMRTWAEENGINMEVLRDYRIGGKGFGGGMGRHGVTSKN